MSITIECLTLIGSAFAGGLGIGYKIAERKAGPADAIDEMTKHCDILAQHPNHDGEIVTFTQHGKLINLRCWAMQGKRFCPLLNAPCQFFRR